MDGNGHFAKVHMTNRGGINNGGSAIDNKESAASFPKSARSMNKFISISPPSTGDSSSSSGYSVITHVMNPNTR